MLQFNLLITLITCWMLLLSDGREISDKIADHVVENGAEDDEIEADGQADDLALDCLAHYENGNTKDGIYDLAIQDVGVFYTPSVFCDMNDGGWTVIQERVDDSVDFFRRWTDYEEGFGDPDGNFWIGLKALHVLTMRGSKLMVYLETYEETSAFAHYSHFQVGSQDTNYVLSVGGYVGTAGDSLVNHNGMPFSTKDNENNEHTCANVYHGAWWYKTCHASNLNGQYLGGYHESFADGINWKAFMGFHYSYKRVVMKIQRTNLYKVADHNMKYL